MKHLKEELWHELESADEKVKMDPGMMTMDDLHMIKMLAKTYYYLCEIEEEHKESYSVPEHEQMKKGIY